MVRSLAWNGRYRNMIVKYVTSQGGFWLHRAFSEQLFKTLCTLFLHVWPLKKVMYKLRFFAAVPLFARDSHVTLAQ